VRVAHERTDAMHTAGRIELIHRTSIHSRHGLPAASIPAAGPRSRRLHDIPILREMQNSRKRLQNNSFDRPAPGTALNGLALFDNVRASILQTLDTASGHPVENRHATTQCRLADVYWCTSRTWARGGRCWTRSGT
jgi:hypothetical protein